MHPEIVFCTDIEIPYIYGTFFEVIYKLKSEDKDVIPCIIVGDRQVDKLDKICDFIDKYFNIKENNIYTYAGLNSLDNEQLRKIYDFSESVLDNIHDIESLKKIYYEDLSIGIPVAASLIMKRLCSKPDIEDNYELLKNYFKYSAFNYEAAKMFLAKQKFDNCYVYNGRTYNTYPITCLINEDQIFYYERKGEDRDRLIIQRGRIHDLLWNSTHKLNLIKKYKEADNSNLISRIPLNKHNKFSINFSDNFNPDTSKKIISYFNSSNDEFASLHPSIITNTIFSSQEEAILWLIEWAANQNDYLLVIRVHPHQEYKCAKDRNFWNNLNGKNTLVIPSSSNIDSFSIIQKSDKVVTYRSSMSVFACSCNIPVISLGVNNYTGHDCFYEPESKSEFGQLLFQSLEPKSLENLYLHRYFDAQSSLNFAFLDSLKLASFDDLEKLVYTPEKFSNFTQAMLNAGRGKWESAEDAMARAYAYYDDLTDGFAQLGWIKYEATDYRGAVELMLKDYKQGRMSPEWQINLALALGDAGDFKSAEAVVERAYQADGTLKDGFGKVAARMMAYPVKDWANAERLTYRDSSHQRLNPNRLINNIIPCRIGLGNIDGAVKLVEEIYAQEQQATDGYGRVGWMGFLNGQGIIFFQEMLDKDLSLNRFSAAGKKYQAFYHLVSGIIEPSADYFDYLYTNKPAAKNLIAMIAGSCWKYLDAKICCDLFERDYAMGRLQPIYSHTYAVALNTLNQHEKAMEMLEYALRYRQKNDLIFIGNILFPDVVTTCDQLRQFIEQGYGFQDLPRLKTDDNLSQVAPHMQGHSHVR